MKKVAIAWREDTDDIFSKRVVEAIKHFNFKPYFLPQVKADFFEYEGAKLNKKHLDLSSNSVEQFCMLSFDSAEKIKKCEYSSTNVESVLGSVDAVVFTGGDDISPSLFSSPQKAENNGERFNAERDVSDYILMKYCLEHNIKVFAICRGMQMMAILNNGKVIQDLENYYTSKNILYDYTHRKKDKNDYAYHGITFNKESLTYKLFGCKVKDGFIDNIPSWHHQAVLSCENNVTISAVYNTHGEDIIEAIEIKDKAFFVGVQFHIEAFIAKKIYNIKEEKVNKKLCETFFKNVLEELIK